MDTEVEEQLFGGKCSYFLLIDLIAKNIKNLSEGNETLTVQDESKATYWEGRRPDDGEINLNGSVYEAERLVRALNDPYPGAFYFDNNGSKRIVWKASIADEISGDNCLKFYDGILELLEVD